MLGCTTSGYSFCCRNLKKWKTTHCLFQDWTLQFKKWKSSLFPFVSLENWNRFSFFFIFTPNSTKKDVFCFLFSCNKTNKKWPECSLANVALIYTLIWVYWIKSGSMRTSQDFSREMKDPVTHKSVTWCACLPAASPMRQTLCNPPLMSWSNIVLI